MPPLRSLLFPNSYNKSVDYWALGILCFEMLAGNSPFADPYGFSDQMAIYCKVSWASAVLSTSASRIGTDDILHAPRYPCFLDPGVQVEIPEGSQGQAGEGTDSKVALTSAHKTDRLLTEGRLRHQEGAFLPGMPSLAAAGALCLRSRLNNAFVYHVFYRRPCSGTNSWRRSSRRLGCRRSRTRWMSRISTTTMKMST